MDPRGKFTLRDLERAFGRKASGLTLLQLATQQAFSGQSVVITINTTPRVCEATFGERWRLTIPLLHSWFEAPLKQLAEHGILLLSDRRQSSFEPSSR
jgi:hypothetical protein